MSGRSDDPVGPDSFQAARPVGQAFRKMHAVSLYAGRQSPIGSHQQKKTAISSDLSQARALGGGVRRTEGPEDDRSAARKRLGDGLWVWRSDRIGEEEQVRQGLSPTVAAP